MASADRSQCLSSLLTLFPLALSQNPNITVKEVNKALDLESKKIQEANKWNNQSLVTLSRIKNGIAVLNGERRSTTDSPPLSPSSTPSHSPAIVQEGEDAANTNTNSNPPEQTPAPVPTEEQDSADKENHKSSQGKETRLTKNVRVLLLLLQSYLKFCGVVQFTVLADLF